MGAVPGLTAFADRAALMAAAADAIALALAEGCARRGAGCAALSGGSTPGPAYAALAVRNLDWPRIVFGLVDERCVPPKHPGSNEGLLRRVLAPALGSGARLEPMFVEGQTPHAAALAANERYARLRLDIAVMGMGADGHTASWFPAARGLDQALDPAGPNTVIAVHAPAAAGAADRLTLTLAAVAEAELVLLLIAGGDKRSALEQALDRPPREAPVAALFGCPRPPTIYWAP